MIDRPELHVSLYMISDDPETITRAMEVLGRAAAGLALEGISASLSATKIDKDTDDDA